MDNYQLKSGKRTQRHSLIVNLIGGAILLVIVILVLLYGRIEPIYIPEAEEQTSDDGIDELLLDDEQRKEKITDDTIGESSNDEQREALRQKYIAQMNRYENEIKPRINALNLALWSPENASELQAKEQAAIRAFAENQFAVALTHLDNLFEKVAELQLLQKQNFESALSNAEQAFVANQIVQAQSAINEALRYLPEASKALQLKERISTMEAVAILIKQADIARIENNTGEEINLLEQAIELDPYRGTLIERHKTLIAKQRQQKLDALLQQTSQALDDKNIKTARTSLMQIKQMDANHPSLNPLTAKLKQIETELSYQNLITQAKSSANTDNWQSAENYYRQALEIYPDNKDTEDNLQRAMQINRYTGIIKQVLAKPERLADEQIAAAMKQIADDSTLSAKYSAQLQQLVVRLNDAIAEMSKPVAVTVYSDEKTYVSVLGVGVIGKVREYKLKEGLKPGRYRFKGERKGYQDKLVEIEIKPNQPATVKVICDETI